MTDRELMQMALDAMESFESGTNGLYKGEFAEERKALRDRLARPTCQENRHVADNATREWVGLTDEEVYLMKEYPECCEVSIRRAEDLLKQKNTRPPVIKEVFKKEKNT
jgi:hypothetical protein